MSNSITVTNLTDGQMSELLAKLREMGYIYAQHVRKDEGSTITFDARIHPSVMPDEMKRALQAEEAKVEQMFRKAVQAESDSEQRSKQGPNNDAL